MAGDGDLSVVGGDREVERVAMRAGLPIIENAAESGVGLTKSVTLGGGANAAIMAGAVGLAQP
jgi:hypothetical protein